MQVEVDSTALRASAAALAERAAEVRRQAAACARIPDEVAEPRLRDAVHQLAEVAADALAMAALDLGLLAADVRAATGRYDGVEQGLAGLAGPALPGAGPVTRS